MHLKKLLEQRKQLQADLLAIVDTCDGENRAMTEEEKKNFEETEAKIKSIDDSIAAEKRARELMMDDDDDDDHGKGGEDRAESEERAFEAYIRGEESRADLNMTLTDNGAVIPTSIADRIIEKVKEISPVYSLSEKFNVKGNLTFPMEDDSTHITMTYADEFKALTGTKEKFKNISLGGFLAGALSKVSKSLINNANFPIVDYVIRKMSEAIARFLEKELLHGTEGKITGLSTVDQVITSAVAGVVTSDELIDVQEEVPDAFQGSAIWVMNKKTRTAIRKLKDADGNYLLNRDVNAKWGYTLLGKDVYCSDQMDLLGAGKTPIYYGDFSGLYTNIHEDINIEVLREKYADEHVVGVIGWLEVDSKLVETQKVSALKQPA